MSNKLDFYRSFLIFNQEDIGFSTVDKPSGYVRIEVRDGKGRLDFLLQNLREDKNKISYKAYIIKCDKIQTLPVLAGSIPIEKNRGELSWGFDPSDVAGTGSSIDKFNVAAVLVDNQKTENKTIICPLAAYKDGILDWRDKARKAIYPDAINDMGHTDAVDEQDLYSTYAGGIESKYIPGKKALKINEGNMPETDEEYELPFIKGDYGKMKQPFVMDDIDQITQPFANDNYSQMTQPFVNDNDQMTKPFVNDDNGQMKQPFAKDDYDQITQPFSNNYTNTGIENMAENADTGILENNTTGCIYKENSPCSMLYKDSAFNPCTYCNVYRKNDKAVKKNGDVEMFKAMMNKYFERQNIFNSRRSDYKWWKVNSPVYLNNILYKSGINTALIFNPRVMMAHYKYKHLIAGIYKDRSNKKEYIVSGVPGVYSIDDNPFGDMCRWVQLEGYKPKYGSFGYWLVYIDPASGKLLKLS